MTAAQHTALHELLQQAIGPACHELRSPLAVVYGFARMLETSDDGDDARGAPATLRYVPQIVRGAERLDLLLDDLAQLGRIAAGRVHPQLESVAVREIIDQLASDGANEQRLVVDAGSDVHVLVDRQWLAAAVAAVVEGLCYEDGVDLRLSWHHVPHEVRIQVVPSSSFPMIDVEPEKSSLGISLARMRIVAMGGTFEGAGDRVVITLPRPHG